MIRYLCAAWICLRVMLIGLILTACASLAVSVTPSAIATESLLPSETPLSEDTTSQIDQILSLHTEEEAFTSAVLVTRKGEILLSQGYGWADRDHQVAAVVFKKKNGQAHPTPAVPCTRTE